MPQVLDWCAAAGLADAWAARRWRSEPEWRAAVSQRRAAAHPLPTFLQRLLLRLGMVRRIYDLFITYIGESQRRAAGPPASSACCCAWAWCAGALRN